MQCAGIYVFVVIILLQALINEGVCPDEYEFEASVPVSAKSDISLSTSFIWCMYLSVGFIFQVPID